MKGLRPKAPAPGWKFLRSPDYITRDATGRIVEIRCKICGRVISSVSTAVVQRIIEGDGRTIEQVETRLRYNANYAEMVIHMEDGGNHVTSGCKMCFAGKLKDWQLKELVKADYDEQHLEEFAPMITEALEARTVTRASVFDAQKLGVGR